MDEVGRPSRATRGQRVRRRGTRARALPSTARLSEVADDPVPVGEAEVPKRRGRDDVDLHSRRPQVLDRVAHEDPCDVVRPARIRRREDGDPHSRRAPEGDDGSAAASVANT